MPGSPTTDQRLLAAAGDRRSVVGSGGSRVEVATAVVMAVFATFVALTLAAFEVSGQNRDGVVFSDQSCTTIGETGLPL